MSRSAPRQRQAIEPQADPLLRLGLLYFTVKEFCWVASMEPTSSQINPPPLIPSTPIVTQAVIPEFISERLQMWVIYDRNQDSRKGEV